MIYICVPALDEARTVGVLLWKIRRVMAEFPRDYHILVMDDGSTDGTEEVLAPYARVLPLTVLRNPVTQGYAASLERLAREVVARSTHPKRDVAITMQADFTEAPEDIPTLVKRIEGGADLVGASAPAEGGAEARSRRWIYRGAPLLFRRAPLPLEIGDPLSGFRAYRVLVLKRALEVGDGGPLLSGRGWAANVELLLAVAPHARRTEGAEISFHPHRRQRETRFRPWGTVRELWDLARRARRMPRIPVQPEPAKGA